MRQEKNEARKEEKEEEEEEEKEDIEAQEEDMLFCCCRCAAQVAVMHTSASVDICIDTQPVVTARRIKTP